MSDSAVRVTVVRAGDRGRPEHLATPRPELSWAVDTDIPYWTQASVEVEVRLDDGVVATTRDTSGSQRQPWPARDLRPYERGAVRVRVTGADGSTSDWSPWTDVVTGPLTPQDWRAAFVTASTPAPERGSIRLRTVVDLPDDVVSAVLSVTAHGVYEAWFAGERVGDEQLAPGWTAYDDVLTVQSYDVTDAAARGGAVVLGATVAEGWFGERYGFNGSFARAYSGPQALSAQLRLEDAAGRVTWVTTDETWESTATGPVTAAGIYGGESYDARLADDALLDPSVPLPDAAPAAVVDADAGRLVPASSPPVRETQTVAAQRVFTSPSGATLVDFGQNLVGWLRMSVTGPAGTTVTLRHAEVLEDGELGVRPLRFAEATDRYTLRGGDSETWSPRFTFHGFRYAEVAGWPGDLRPQDVTAVVVHSDMARTGHLTTSDPRLDRLHENVVWGMRGNFLGLPTDCPQRDERLGWTGDIQVFAPTASYLYDVSGFLGSWLRDLAAEQRRLDGVVPFVVPSPMPFDAPPAAAWGDAATLIPATLHERYGDTAVLERQYASMRGWVESVRELAGTTHLWTGGFQFGDWLDPAAPPDNPAAARTDADVVASAYYYRSTAVLAQAAALLGHDDDAATYGALAERIRAAFLAEFVTPSGRMMSDAHTGYSIALVFGLVTDPAQAARLGDRLAELVRAHGYRIATGFVGTPLICDALSMTGHTDVAYRLLTEDGCPSWLYPVTMGATTIWERWDSMLPDGSINPGEMTSFNHYALGAVADWMHRTIGGIAPAEPGYRVVDVRPVPGGGLTSARASLDAGYGETAVAWSLDGEDFRLEVRVPANTRARVTLPGSGETVEVGSGQHTWTDVVPAPPAPPQEPWGLDTSLARFMDDDDARETLLTTLAEMDFWFSATWTASGRWRSDTALGQVLLMMPADRVTQVERAVLALNERTGR